MATKQERELRGLEQTHERLYKCRDLEISNLWQRSIVITVFLTLTLTAYGILSFHLLDRGFFCEKALRFHIAALPLSIVGFTFSIIWILMGKASKAWYEVYEKAITEFEEDYETELDIPSYRKIINRSFRMGNLDKTEIKKGINNSIWSNKAGAYSPSKINILVGKVFLIIWMIVFIVHSGFLICFLISNFCNDTLCLICSSNMISIFIYLIVIVLAYLLIIVLKKQARSGYLNEE